jgi:ATP-dependent helicase/nuclease subunit B
VPSRFLLQLETVLQALGYKNMLMPPEPWQSWAQMLDEPQGQPKPCMAPEPRPPRVVRPTQLSVTEIGTWQRNPYAIYAKHILHLRKLNPLDAEIDVADRGTAIHEALDRFIKAFPTRLPDNAREELLGIGRQLFAAYDEHPQVNTFWWPRFERIAKWFIANEHERRAAGIKVLQGEASGKIVLDSFTLKGRADRIDRLPDGTLAIIDYKTGAVPKAKDVTQGLEPQLPLLALIAQQGGFDGLDHATVGEISYWGLNGGRHVADVEPIKTDVMRLAKEAQTGLENLVKTFADPATPYQAVPKPNRRPRYDDYSHLARLAEWGRTGGGA